MALSCKINEQLFTFNGKEYNYNEFRALMYDGLLDQALKPAAPAAQVAATTAPKGAVDASDADAMQGLMERHEGINANKVSKPQLIGRVANGIRWLTNNKLGYDANTGKGNRIFVAESKAEYERITKDASGKAKTGGGVAIPRYDADGNYMGADIYINLDTKSLGTVAHELAHVALMEKFAGDPNLFKKFVAAIKPFASAKDLAYLDKFVRQYADEEVRPEEFLAEMTAKIEERFVDGEVGAKELSALRKLAEAIKQFINKLTGGLVFPLEKESDVRAFFNALGQSIAVGGVMKEGLAEAAAREVDEAFSKQIASEANKPAELRERIEDPAFGPKIKYKKGGYALSLVKESDLIDIKALVKKIADEGGRVWFWTADQLGRGMYSDDTLLGEHYLDAGPSFALDPKNRKNNVIWASGLDSKTLNGYIGKSDYIFIVSGSPQKSKLFNKAVTEVLKERAEKATGLSWDDFTKKLIELDSQKEDGRPKKATVISSILEKYKSFDEFLESGDRKDFFLRLEDAMGKTTTALAKYLKDKNYSLDVNALRDGFYAENEFGANDVMIVLKATGVDETQRHATYNKSIIGEVIGVPDRRVNAINLLPEEQQVKLSSALKSGTPMGGASGATVRTLGTPLFETVETKPRREAMERKEEEAPRGKTASIAPFYRLRIRDRADAERVAKTPAYKNFESTLNDLADAMGVKIDRIKPGVGKWGGIMELSAKVQFAPGQKFAKIREYAAIMGALAPESQDTTIAGEYVKDGDKRTTGYAIRIPTNDVDAAIALAESSGLYGLDVDTENGEAVIFANNEDDVKQAESLADQFRIQGIGTGELTAEPLITEFIGEAKRADILKNVSNRLQGEAGRQQGGARLRNLVKLAQERDAAFQRLKGYEPTREKYAKLRNLQIELLEKGKDLSALDKKRLESNRRRLTPAIEQQFGSWQDAYQEAKDEIAKVGDRIAEAFGGYNIPFNIKNIGRATIKTLDWYMGHPTLLGDGARTTIIVDDIAKADEVFDRIKEEYYSPREENYTTDLGYPKRLLEVLTANGRLAEFQVMTPEAYLAKDGVELFPEAKRAEITKRLNKIQSIIGASVPDGMGHLFYELQRDPKVSSSLRDATKEPSNLYYKAFMDPESMKGKGDELMKSIASLMDKFKAEKANEGTWAAKHWTKNQKLVDKFNEAYSEPSKPRRGAMERKEDELPPDTPEETRKVITVAQRRLDKIEGDEKRATERDVLMGDPGNYVEEKDYRTAIDQARNFVAELYFKYANLSPVDFSKAVYEEVKGISNEVSKVVAYGELQASLDMYAESKKLSSKDRKEIQRISAKMVSDMAQRARKMGQANAALALVYNNYGKFASLVQAEKINQEFTAKLNSTEGSEEGKTIADNIEEARDEIKETLGQNKEIADVVDLAEEINDALEDGHAAKVAAGKSTPLDAPAPVTAEQLVNSPASYDKIISDLEAEVKRLDGLLAEANKLYSSAAADAASYAQQIADLNREINRKNKLIDKLKAKKDEIAKERDKYKSQLETLKQKIQNLKDINKLLAQKRVGKNRLSPSTIEKLRQQLLDLALAGKLNDPDFDSVFAAITGSNFLTTQDRKAIEHMANALKYFESAGSKEMAQKYVKRLNDYLEQQSKSPWTAAKVAILLQSWFYNNVLSSIGTFFNAFAGSVLVSIPNATVASINIALKGPKSGLGATLYGMLRMLKELPTAISKGAMNQRAYDSMGTSWTVDSVSRYADPFEVHVLNGFFTHWNKIKNNPSLVEKSKASIALLGSIVAQATRITALLKFIDPVLRHSIAAHMEGMQDYIKIKGEMRMRKTEPGIAEAWTPYFSPKLIKKIDEMAGVARADRSVAAFTALRDIATMKSRGIPIPLGYARRRTSEIMREKRDAEQTLTTDKMAADMIMMWKPDGVLGYAWDKLGKKTAIREGDNVIEAFTKLALNLSVLPFLRISAQGVSEIQSTIPVIGGIAAAYGVAKNKDGEWYVGKKYSENVQDREFEIQRMQRRITLNILSSVIIASMFAEAFDVEDAEDDDEEAMNVFGMRKKITLDPDRKIDFTSDARGPKSANQGIMEGRANFSIRVRAGSNEEWSDWMSVRLAPHMTIPVAWFGRLSDDANRLYQKPAFGSGATPKRAALNEYFTSVPLSALGEISFQTIPRFVSGLKYDAGAAAARMFMSPVAAIAQPAIYRDVVSTAASMADATRKGEYMPEGFVETSKAMFSSLYGLNYSISPEVTDEYGLPIKAIDPIRSWWKNYTEIEKRSDDYPEVNLRWKYGNTFISATPRAQRLEAVDRDISSLPPKEGLYAKKIELTKEQQYESALLAKALYRFNTLRNYDVITLKAEQAKAQKGKGEMPGEVVAAELDAIHNDAMETVKSIFSQYASGTGDWNQRQVLQVISQFQAASDELSKQVMERGPLPPAQKELQLYKGENIIEVVK